MRHKFAYLNAAADASEKYALSREQLVGLLGAVDPTPLRAATGIAAGVTAPEGDGLRQGVGGALGSLGGQVGGAFLGGLGGGALGGLAGGAMGGSMTSGMPRGLAGMLTGGAIGGLGGMMYGGYKGTQAGMKAFSKSDGKKDGRDSRDGDGDGKRHEAPHDGKREQKAHPGENATNPEGHKAANLWEEAIAKAAAFRPGLKEMASHAQAAAWKAHAPSSGGTTPAQSNTLLRGSSGARELSMGGGGGALELNTAPRRFAYGGPTAGVGPGMATPVAPAQKLTGMDKIRAMQQQKIGSEVALERFGLQKEALAPLVAGALSLGARALPAIGRGIAGMFGKAAPAAGKALASPLGQQVAAGGAMAAMGSMGGGAPQQPAMPQQPGMPQQGVPGQR